LQALSRGRSSVTLAPWAENWTDQLRGGDVFVHLASPESFGIVVLEAFARGLRLVVGEDTFLDSLPEPQRTLGIFRVRHVSPAAVSEQVRLALQCGISAADLWRARREVAMRFDAGRNAQRLADLYRDLTAPACGKAR
jgi:glycosyltransferase involved in cell wall biosynthesis